MKRAIIGPALVIGFLLSGAAPALATAPGADAGDEPCICTKEYAPVRGSDGKIYGNACEARCAGVEVVSADETTGDGQTGAYGSGQAAANGGGQKGSCPETYAPYSP